MRRLAMSVPSGCLVFGATDLTGKHQVARKWFFRSRCLRSNYRSHRSRPDQIVSAQHLDKFTVYPYICEFTGDHPAGYRYTGHDAFWKASTKYSGTTSHRAEYISLEGYGQGSGHFDSGIAFWVLQGSNLATCPSARCGPYC